MTSTEENECFQTFLKALFMYQNSPDGFALCYKNYSVRAIPQAMSFISFYIM